MQMWNIDVSITKILCICEYKADSLDLLFRRNLTIRLLLHLKVRHAKRNHGIYKKLHYTTDKYAANIMQ